MYDPLIATLQTVVASETQINASRSLSKMKSVFMSLGKVFTEERAINYINVGANFWPPSAGNATRAIAHNEERCHY